MNTWRKKIKIQDVAFYTIILFEKFIKKNNTFNAKIALRVLIKNKILLIISIWPIQSCKIKNHNKIRPDCHRL